MLLFAVRTGPCHFTNPVSQPVHRRSGILISAVKGPLKLTEKGSHSHSLSNTLGTLCRSILKSQALQDDSLIIVITRLRCAVDKISALFCGCIFCGIYNSIPFLEISDFRRMLSSCAEVRFQREPRVQDFGIFAFQSCLAKIGEGFWI